MMSLNARASHQEREWDFPSFSSFAYVPRRIFGEVASLTELQGWFFPKQSSLEQKPTKATKGINPSLIRQPIDLLVVGAGSTGCLRHSRFTRSGQPEFPAVTKR
jgi:hypothetical protein